MPDPGCSGPSGPMLSRLVSSLRRDRHAVAVESALADAVRGVGLELAASEPELVTGPGRSDVEMTRLVGELARRDVPVEGFSRFVFGHAAHFANGHVVLLAGAELVPDASTGPWQIEDLFPAAGAMELHLRSRSRRRRPHVVVFDALRCP